MLTSDLLIPLMFIHSEDLLKVLPRLQLRAFDFEKHPVCGLQLLNCSLQVSQPRFPGATELTQAASGNMPVLLPLQGGARGLQGRGTSIRSASRRHFNTAVCLTNTL